MRLRKNARVLEHASVSTATDFRMDQNIEGKGDFNMATVQLAITHEGSELLRKAIQMVKRYGKRDDEGNVNLRFTYRAFASAFGHIDGIREAIDEVESRFDRIGFFILPDCVQISLNVQG